MTTHSPWGDTSIIESKLDQIHIDNQALIAAIQGISSSGGSDLPSPWEDSGVASSGTNSTLVDNAKNWPVNSWFNALLSIRIDNVRYSTITSGNAYNQLNFAVLPVAIKPGSPYRIHNVVTQVSSGQIRPGLALNDNQQLLVFVYIPTDYPPGITFPYPIPWVQPVLAPGSVSHIYNSSTGTSSPFLVPKGYTFNLFEKGMGFNQDCEVWIFYDNLLVSQPFSVAAGSEIDISQIIGINTALFDPIGAFPHLIDAQIVNKGLGNMRGAIQFGAILEKVI